MILNKFFAALFFVLAICCLAGCANKAATTGSVYSRYEPQASPRSLTVMASDTLLETRVKARFRRDDLIDAREIDVTVTHGIVRLSGWADNAATARMSADLARGVEGVVRVENEIKIRD